MGDNTEFEGTNFSDPEDTTFSPWTAATLHPCHQKKLSWARRIFCFSRPFRFSDLLWWRPASWPANQINTRCEWWMSTDSGLCGYGCVPLARRYQGSIIRTPRYSDSAVPARPETSYRREASETTRTQSSSYHHMKHQQTDAHWEFG